MFGKIKSIIIRLGGRVSVSSMKPLQLSKSEARRILLKHQGLWPPYQLRGKPGIVEFIQKVGCIQYDPLNKIGRNHELVLQARIGDFRSDFVTELLYADRQLLDGWDKMMSIYSVSDWPNFRRYREKALCKYGASERPIHRILPEVRQALLERGPLASLDLEFDQTVNWAWAPTRLSRAALESMYFWGELIVHHKFGTRKYYDYAERHLPQALLEASDPFPTGEVFHDWLVLRRIGGIGLLWNRSGDAWLGLDLKTPERMQALERLHQQGLIIQAAVTGCKYPFYLRTQDWDELKAPMETEPTPNVSIIAPLDNLVWDRRLIAELFDFDYRWEVYKPASQREYGYYVLPVLYGDRFIARIEPELSKDKQSLIIKNWWWEAKNTPSAAMNHAIDDCLQRLQQRLGVKTVQVQQRFFQ